MTEDALARAQRHVWEAERHVAHLVRIIEELERSPVHGSAAATARKVLGTLQESLRLAREHLSMERRERGLE
ncbi:MAG: hypothetical protein JO110_25810 [Acetobacteraceae bacterium]|nr:hypothetical protein [Acetobacteraceae bacterium]